VIFGIFLSPLAWVMVSIGALFAIILPFVFFEWLASYMPESLRVPTSLGLTFIAFPILLCVLHKRKVFGVGRGSAFFWIYTIMFSALGMLFLIKGVTGSPPESMFENTAGGAIITFVGIAMFVWARRTNEKLSAAIVSSITSAREEQVNIQAEAILRADSIKRDKELS